MTGDIVHSGEDERDWKIFDEETKILRDEKIRMFPVLGNHDVRGASGQKKFVEHFDELKSHPQLATQAWYTVNYSSTEFLLLDSQSSYEEQSPQGEWLRKKLKSVPEDLVFLVVVLHHPLISNASRFPSVYHCNGRQSGPAFGHSVESAEKHLRVLLEQFSTTHPGVRLLVLSGHNHNYERYAVNGITYVVTAGGGATPYRISRRPRDAYREDGPTFHYCKFIIRDTSMTGEMYKLTFEAGAPVWVQKDKFELSRPSTQSPNSKPPTSMPQQP
jgi:3',5'-cyclic AMP phosphodiesterase CpdA